MGTEVIAKIYIIYICVLKKVHIRSYPHLPLMDIGGYDRRGHFGIVKLNCSEYLLLVTT